MKASRDWGRAWVLGMSTLTPMGSSSGVLASKSTLVNPAFRGSRIVKSPNSSASGSGTRVDSSGTGSSFTTARGWPSL